MKGRTREDADDAAWFVAPAEAQVLARVVFRDA